MRPRPPALLLATAAQGVEAAGLLVAAVLTAADTAAGRSYQRSSGIALTVIAFGAVIVVALIAVGIYRVRRWSRTPALLTQLFVGTTGVYLVEGHRLDWGVPALLVALAGFAGLLVPSSWRALATGPASPSVPASPASPATPATPAPPGGPAVGPGRPPLRQEGLRPPPLTSRRGEVRRRGRGAAAGCGPAGPVTRPWSGRRGAG